MKKITLLEFRRNARQVVQWAKRGQRMIMTYRGKPVCRIEPIDDEEPSSNDPFYELCNMADNKLENMTNEEIDKVVYEE